MDQKGSQISVTENKKLTKSLRHSSLKTNNCNFRQEKNHKKRVSWKTRTDKSTDEVEIFIYRWGFGGQICNDIFKLNSNRKFIAIFEFFEMLNQVFFFRPVFFVTFCFSSFTLTQNYFSENLWLNSKIINLVFFQQTLFFLLSYFNILFTWPIKNQRKFKKILDW